MVEGVTMNNLKVEFVTYKPSLKDDDSNDLINFLVLVAQEGLKDNIISGEFPGKVSHD